MKTILTSIVTLFACTMFAQTMSIAETDVQINKGDSLMKSGTVLLSEFMVMRDTVKHNLAMADFASAKAIYDNCMANGTVADNDWGTTIAAVVDAKLMIVSSYSSLYGKRFRDDLMAETEKERSKKVKYNGVEYKVSKNTLEYFELLNPKK